MPKKQPSPERKHAAALMGAVGGKAGRGDAKKRDASHYQVTLAEARRKAATLRKLKLNK